LDTARRMATTMRALARLTMGAPAVPGVDLVEALLKRAEVAVQAVPALQAAVEEGQVWEEEAPVVRVLPWLQRCRLLHVRVHLAAIRGSINSSEKGASEPDAPLWCFVPS